MKKFLISTLVAIMVISLISPANNTWAFEEKTPITPVLEEIQLIEQPEENVEIQAVPLLVGAIIGFAVRKGAQEAIKKYGKQAVDEALSYSYKSYSGLKNRIGSAGTGREWHHIVEQSQVTRSGLSPYLVQSSKNVIDLDVLTHRAVTAAYNKPHKDYIPYASVRTWMDGKPFDVQYKAGVKIMKELGIEVIGFY